MIDTWHPTFEQLGEFANDEGGGSALDAEERTRVEHHIGRCGSCNERLEAIRALLAQVAELPPSIEPPEDLWPAVRAEVERRKVVTLPASGDAPARVRGRQPIRRAALAAAAITLVVASSALTATIMNARSSRTVVSRVTGPAVARVLPASLVATEASYLRTAQQLQASLDEQRYRLSPATIATVENSLRVIDAAIAEARDALMSDPGNQALVDVFSTNYERKLDLLRRATELAPRT